MSNKSAALDADNARASDHSVKRRMGAYKLDQIKKDFDTVTRGLNNLNMAIIKDYKNLAIKIIKYIPDNKDRDFTISNLLSSSGLVRSAIIQGINKINDSCFKID